MAERLTQEYLRFVLDYSPETGIFTWRKREGNKRWNTKYAGKRAGNYNRTLGYKTIRLNNSTNYEHRLVWVYVSGKYPKMKLDHINGDKTDNRIQNLREVNDIQNSINRKTHSNNTSGHKGIKYDKRRNHWVANIGMCGKMRYLGSFPSKEQAVSAYICAAENIHGDYRRAA